MADPVWTDLGPVEDWMKNPVSAAQAGRTPIAITFQDGKFGAISGVCNHAAGPLGEGKLDGEFVVCPWHYYKFDRTTGSGEPGFEDDRVPSHEVKVENGRLFVNPTPKTPRHKLFHEPHPLERALAREPGATRVLGISTTALDPGHPRYSTSEALLDAALAGAKASGAEAKMLKLSELAFRNCEGFYSKSAKACTWPCSITQMDAADQMEQVYEGLVFWADVVLVATPIRWGSASALYFKMAERMNCIQNQITLRDRVLIRDKVAAFIITGGQDNIQAVAGQLLGFFAELGFQFPAFPYIAHSRGWSAEDMENNVRFVQKSTDLAEGARALAARAMSFAELLRREVPPMEKIERAGRKADGMMSP